MKIRLQLIGVACLVALAGTAHAQPGTAYLQARGGAMIPVGSFSDEQNTGGAYTIAAGYELLEFLDMTLEFTQSFNDDDNFQYQQAGLALTSDETKQTFIVSTGPRISFLPSDYRVRPYMSVQIGWYHFANFNSIEIDGRGILSDEDDDAFGFQAGLGVEGTVMQIYERRDDSIPLLEMTAGVYAAYHQAVLTGGRSDRGFVTTMASLGLRF